MTTVVRRASRHGRPILFLLLALVAAGAFATSSIPVSLFPRVSFPRIRVDLDAGDRPAKRMVADITRPAEEALRGVPGVRGIESTTSRGSAEVSVTFDWGADMLGALLQAESAVNRILPTLPAGTTFEVRRMDPTVFPVIAYSLTSVSRPLTELHDLAEYQLRPVLSVVPGVAKIGIDGGVTAEYRVTIDPDQLRAHDLAFSDIVASLSAANVLTAAGRLVQDSRQYLVVTDTTFQHADTIAATVVRSGAGGVTTLGSVATVTLENTPRFTQSTADGRPCVLLNVYQQTDGNTVDIASGIRAALAAEQSHLPKDVTLAAWYDQSDLINVSASGVRDAVLIGVGLAALVLLLFLRSWRMTLVAILAVPVVLGVTALVLDLLGQTLNIMTLGGMAAAVGLIIDDAIVMAEHIARRLHGEQAARRSDGAADRVAAAADEFSKPLAGSSLSTIVIHIPPAFLVGVFGAFFAALSLSMAVSLIISFVVAWLAIPLLASRLLRAKDLREQPPGRVARGANGFYVGLMRRFLRYPWIVLFIIAPILGAGYFAFRGIESGFMPSIDEGGFVLDYKGPPGASLAEMGRLLGQVESILRALPEVDHYSRRTGFSLGGDISETSTGDFFVRLKSLPRRSLDAIMADVRGRVEHAVPGLDFDLSKPMQDLIGDLSGKPQPIVVNLFCDDEPTLLDLAPKVADAIGKVAGVVDVDNGIMPAGDALDVRVDRVKASLEGVDADAVSSQVGALLGGTAATQVQEGPRRIAVRVALPARTRRSAGDLAALNLRAPDGHYFPLGRVAELVTLHGQPEITRADLRRVVAVTARIEGRDLGSAVAAVQHVLGEPGLVPAAVRVEYGGLYAQQQAAFRGLLNVILAAAALVFFLLLAMYENIRVAGSIMLSTLLAIAAVFVGLRCTGTELNISSLMGLVMIVGNVTEVAIFYFSEFATAATGGSIAERLIVAGTHRMRAIVMTTAAAILALLPLAMNLGQGTAMLHPLAVAIIAGLAVQLPLVLIVLPACLAATGAVRPLFFSSSAGSGELP